MVIKDQSKSIICTHFLQDKRYDSKLSQYCKTNFTKETEMMMDSGYQGLQYDNPKTLLLVKKKKRQISLLKLN